MIKAGVIGHPISHSKSPLIQGSWLAQYNITGEYKAYDISPEDFENDIRKLIESGLVGFNVTIPYKQRILGLCSTLSDEARAIGAVNTVTIDKDGNIHGHNTDAFGFVQNLEQTIKNFDWTKYPATVIGAGGAARAILSGLKSKSVGEIRITNRTRASSEELASQFGAKVFDWDERNGAMSGAGLIVNTTSLGMKGQPLLEVDLGAAAVDAVVYDIVYAPLETQLLKQAQSKGLKIVTGIGMLLHQARPAFKMWFGVMPNISKDLLDKVLSG